MSQKQKLNIPNNPTQQTDTVDTETEPKTSKVKNKGHQTILDHNVKQRLIARFENSTDIGKW